MGSFVMSNAARIVHARQEKWKTDPTAYRDHVEEVATTIEDGLEVEIARTGDPIRPDATRLRRWVSAQWVRGVRQGTLARQAQALRARLALLTGDAMHVDT